MNAFDLALDHDDQKIEDVHIIDYVIFNRPEGRWETPALLFKVKEEADDT